MARRLLRCLATVAAIATGSAASAVATAERPAGALQFEQRCSACHAVVPGAKTVIGPNLSDVAGRRAASGDFAYSAALKASGLTWDARTLSAYLAAPAKLVPGTRMPVATPDAARRDPLVAYLMTLRP